MTGVQTCALPISLLTKFVDGKDFVNRAALEKQKKEGVARKLCAFELLEKGVPRNGYEIVCPQGEVIGRVTSGTMSPMMKIGIGLGYVEAAHAKVGENLVDSILKKVDCDIEHTVFSYIPNTAEMAYYGMMEGLQKHLDRLISEQLSGRGASLSEEEIRRIFAQRIRSEKVILKDIKLRTFIAEGNTRNDLAAHVYDITYGSITPHVDNLVIIDDSIVRGTTLRQSIVSILDRLHPKKIVVVSSSPQIRYPNYYGINMYGFIIRPTCQHPDKRRLEDTN